MSAYALVMLWLGYNSFILLAIMAGGEMKLDAFTRVLLWPTIKLLG